MTDPQPVDYGPALHRDKRGNLVPWGGASSVMIEDRPDPANLKRTVRGARRYDGIPGMVRNGSLSKDHQAAADRLRDDFSISQGVRGANETGVRAGFAATGASDAQLDAIGRVRDTQRAVGERLWPALTWVVLGNGSLRALAKSRGMGQATAAKWLRDALDRLVEVFGDE